MLHPSAAGMLALLSTVLLAGCTTLGSPGKPGGAPSPSTAPPLLEPLPPVPVVTVALREMPLAEVPEHASVPALPAAFAEGDLHLETGTASFYGKRFAGRRTANGERFNPKALTAAHPTLPFGSLLRVTNLRNGQSVVVRINDRGPYVHNRVIDLSRAAAEQIGMVHRGLAPVRIELLPDEPSGP